jgi:hypothetical protein
MDEIFEEIAKLLRPEDEGYPEPLDYNSDVDIKITLKSGQISVWRPGRAKILKSSNNKFLNVLLSFLPLWTPADLVWLLEFKKLDLKIGYSDQLKALLDSNSSDLEDLALASESDLEYGSFHNLIEDFCLNSSKVYDPSDPVSYFEWQDFDDYEACDESNEQLFARLVAEYPPEIVVKRYYYESASDEHIEPQRVFGFQPRGSHSYRNVFYPSPLVVYNEGHDPNVMVTVSKADEILFSIPHEEFKLKLATAVSSLPTEDDQ